MPEHTILSFFFFGGGGGVLTKYLFHYLFYEKQRNLKACKVFRQGISCTGMPGHTILSFFYPSIYFVICSIESKEI